MSAEEKQHTTEVLNDLLKINNDRVEGYKKASEETDEPDLLKLFTEFREQSEQNADSLIQQITTVGGEPASDKTTQSGKIYRSWMGVKATFTGKDRKAVLNACEFGEDAAQSAYRAALEDEELPVKVNSLIQRQQAELKKAHDRVRDLRNLTKSL